MMVLMGIGGDQVEYRRRAAGMAIEGRSEEEAIRYQISAIRR